MAYLGEWTVKDHEKALDWFFSRNLHYCCRCPVWLYSLPHRFGHGVPRFACRVCERYVNVKEDRCPCHVLGKFEAVKRTHLKLEKKGVW